MPDPAADPGLAQADAFGRLYLGYSAGSGARAAGRVIPCHSRQASAVLASIARDEAGGIQLPEVTMGAENPSYVVFDSFNNWGVSVPLEPGTVSQTRYMQHAAHWAWRYTA